MACWRLVHQRGETSNRIHELIVDIQEKQRYVYDTVLVPHLKERALELAKVHILNRVGIDD